MEEGQTEKALEISLALRHCPVEFIRIKEEGDRLLADLQAELPQWQVEAAMKQVDSKFSPDPGRGECAGLRNGACYGITHARKILDRKYRWRLYYSPSLIQVQIDRIP